MNHIAKIHRLPKGRKTKGTDKRRLYRAGRESKAYSLPQIEKKGANR